MKGKWTRKEWMGIGLTGLDLVIVGCCAWKRMEEIGSVLFLGYCKYGTSPSESVSSGSQLVSSRKPTLGPRRAATANILLHISCKLPMVLTLMLSESQYLELQIVSALVTRKTRVD